MDMKTTQSTLRDMKNAQSTLRDWGWCAFVVVQLSMLRRLMKEQ